MSIIERLLQFIKNEHITPYEFCKNIGVSKSYLSKLQLTHGNIGSHILSNILAAYPDLDIVWLLTGTQDHHPALPLVSNEQAAEFLTANEIQRPMAVFRPTDIHFLDDADFATPVAGDAMLPTYRPGDILVCRRLLDHKLLIWNRAYVIHSSQGILVRRVKPGPNNKQVSLLADNEAYDPIVINIHSLQGFGLVIGYIRQE